MIHQHGIGFHARHGARIAQGHGTQVVVIAYTAEHRIGALRRLSWGGSASDALGRKRLHKRGGFGRVAVVNRDLVTREGQVAGHRET
ncbi:hypothetical protein RZS08_27825, partial [Arthrospira platensis SPKY1]|nr:hypothetical protein [Arthrospira platensis SPKY1]